MYKIPKEVIDEIMDIIVAFARRDVALYYILKSLRIAYVDERSEIMYAGTDGRQIVLFRNWLELEPRDRYYVIVHELFHVILRHPWRGKQILERYGYDKQYLLNVVMDSKVNYLIEKSMRASSWVLNTYVGFSYEDLEVCSVEELFEKLLEFVDRTKFNPQTRTGKDLIFYEVGDIGETISEGSERLRTGDAEVEVQKIVRNALLAKKNAGQTLSAIEERILDELMKGKVNWRTVFRQYLHDGITKNYVTTWVRPNRRIPELAGVKQISKPRVWVLVDVSGSVRKEEFEQFMSEVYNMIPNVSEIQLITFDTAITNMCKITSRRQIENVKIKGGGGTVLSPVLRAILDRVKRHDILVLLTDGHIFDEGESKQILEQLRCFKILVTTDKNIDGFDVSIKIEVEGGEL